MQGIFKGFKVMLHDSAWTVALTLTQDDNGTSHYVKALEILQHSGNAAIIKEAKNDGG